MGPKEERRFKDVRRNLGREKERENLPWVKLNSRPEDGMVCCRKSRNVEL